MKGDERQSGLDFMRTVACLLVIFYHFSTRIVSANVAPNDRLAYNFFSAGSFGVSIFFVLSGFLLSWPFWLAYDRGLDVPSLFRFFVRRAARIVPGYYAAIVFTIVVSGLFLGIYQSSKTIAVIVAGLLFLNSFHPVTFFPIEADAPLWSIGMEVWCYILLAVAMYVVFIIPWRSKMIGRATFALIAIVCLALHRAVSSNWGLNNIRGEWLYGPVKLAVTWMPAYHPLSFFAIFAIGALLASVSVLTNGRTAALDLLALGALCGAGIVMVMAGAAGGDIHYVQNIPYAFPIFPAFIAIAIAALPHTKMLPILTDGKFARFMAQISFGMYLYHYPIIEVAKIYWFPYFQYGATFSYFEFFGASAVIMLVVIAVSSASWVLLERPIMNWTKDRLAARMRVQ